MRSIFLTGGFVGFFVCALTGVLAGRASDLVLRDAAFGCLVGAFLFRWLWSVFVRVLSQAVQAKRAAEAAAEAKAEEKAAVPTPVKSR
jgi:hypothetical protein